MGNSIDEFLEDRRTYTDVVTAGKAVIAALIGHEIKSHRGPAPYEDWLRYLVYRMREGAENPKDFMGRNLKTRFVTFNFDPFIESKIPLLINDTYGTPAVEGFPHVTHVHGKLEEFKGDQARTNNHWLQWVSGSIDRIKITSEEIDPTVLAESMDAISNANVVYFLGFSFHPTNEFTGSEYPKP